MLRAMVLGVNGQDGSYAAEALLRRGYDVTGIGRQTASHYLEVGNGFDYVTADLTDGEVLNALLRDRAPHQLYHYAAVHGPASNNAYEAVWRDMVSVNVLSLYTVLEYARLCNPSLRVVYAGSSKILGSALCGRIDETVPRASPCLYSNTKNSAYDLIGYYRTKHGIAGSNLILFNHESIRRPAEFFMPQLVRCLQRALEGSKTRHMFRTLDFYADWSSAAELTDIAIDIAERDEGNDVIMASGQTWHARALVQEFFARYGLDSLDHVGGKEPSLSPESFQVGISRLETLTGRRPVAGILDILCEMQTQAIPC